MRDAAPHPLDQLLAYPVLFLLLFKAPGLSLFPVFTFAAVFGMLSLLIPTVSGSVPLRRLTAAAVTAAISGCLVLFLTASSGSDSSLTLQRGGIILWVLAFPALTSAALWALSRVSLHWGLVAILLGAVVSSLSRLQAFDWKGDYGIFITALLLAVFVKRRHLTRLTLVASSAASALSDARTMALITIVVLICTFLSPKQMEWMRARPKKALILIFGGLLIASYLVTQAMSAGLLGRAVQLRTLNQLGTGQDIVSAGRTEWAATLDLFKNSPWGFGLGVVPSPDLQVTALNAVQAAGGDYSNTHYWTLEVFGVRTDLHSMLADMWAHFSVGGLWLAFVIAMALAIALPYSISAVRTLGAFPIFAVLTAAWDLLFSPMGNSDRLILGLIAAAVTIHLQRAHQLDNIPPIHKRQKKYTSRETLLMSLGEKRTGQ